MAFKDLGPPVGLTDCGVKIDCPTQVFFYMFKGDEFTREEIWHCMDISVTKCLVIVSL